MHATRSALKGTALVNASPDTSMPAELVTVRILRDALGKPTGLDVRSGMQRDPIIFWTPPGKPASPSRARQVLWNTVDLRRGERMHIRSKSEPEQHDHFRWDDFELDDRHFMVATGAVQAIDPNLAGVKAGPAALALSPATAREVKAHKFVLRGAWHYSVVLHSEELGEPLTLDPVIVIVEDP